MYGHLPGYLRDAINKLPLAGAADLLPAKRVSKEEAPLGPPVVRELPAPQSKAGSASKNLSEIRPSEWLRGQDLNLRPSGYEAPEQGLQPASERPNPSELLQSQGGASTLQVQTESGPHKDFGQPVVSERPATRDDDHAERLFTPAQAAAEFHVPEYLLRQACTEGRLEHLRVVNALWLMPAKVAAFANSWRLERSRKDT